LPDLHDGVRYGDTGAVDEADTEQQGGAVAILDDVAA
jgi:hypothetical protein